MDRSKLGSSRKRSCEASKEHHGESTGLQGFRRKAKPAAAAALTSIKWKPRRVRLCVMRESPLKGVMPHK